MKLNNFNIKNNVKLIFLISFILNMILFLFFDNYIFWKQYDNKKEHRYLFYILDIKSSKRLINEFNNPYLIKYIKNNYYPVKIYYNSKDNYFITSIPEVMKKEIISEYYMICGIYIFDKNNKIISHIDINKKDYKNRLLLKPKEITNKKNENKF